MIPGDPTPRDPVTGAAIPGDPVPRYPVSRDLARRAEAWITEDPGLADRAELQDLLDAAQRDDPAGRAAAADLADRFAGRLEFGTAGLRGAMGAGPNRMNQAVVRAATAGLARWLREHRPAAAQAGVVLGWDARHRSAEFAAEATAVLTGAGIRVHLLPGRSPTPLLAFAVRHRSAGAGVMITASHNPPADNGYKLYLGDGAQIVPPVDAQIEAAIRDVGPLRAIPLGPPDSPLITRHGDEIAQAYLDAILAASPGVPPPGRVADLLVVYTPLHGVAGPLMLRAIRRAGYPAPQVVAAQAEPDPYFPTVPFPNPEEPGALDLALAYARDLSADLVLASDPDGDRLAVAVPDPGAESGWRTLTGDQVGALLGAFVLGAVEPGAVEPGAVEAEAVEAETVEAGVLEAGALEPGTVEAEAVEAGVLEAGALEPGTVEAEAVEAGVLEAGALEPGTVEAEAVEAGVLEAEAFQAGAVEAGALEVGASTGQGDPRERLAASTVVSSSLLSKIAAAAGVQYAETLTGFKWIVRAADERPGTRFVFGYEEALGYAVGDVVRDKDGIGAALAMLGLTAQARAAGQSVLDRWDALETAYGVHLTAQLTLPTRAPGEIMAGLRAAPPAALGESPVRSVTDLAPGSAELPPTDALIVGLDGARVVVRPSGTEPKLKAYLEVTEPVPPGGLAEARRRAGSRMTPLRAAVRALLAPAS
jgi:phosphomannomutase